MKQTVPRCRVCDQPNDRVEQGTTCDFCTRLLTDMANYPDDVFVFGSNESGRHGAGAALTAQEDYGAQPGVGVGMTGRCYAIPTKDRAIRTLPIHAIAAYIAQFIDYAASHPDQRFWVTRIGCGLAGYSDEDIAPLFAHAPANCELPKGWREWGQPQPIADNMVVGVWTCPQCGYGRGLTPHVLDEPCPQCGYLPPAYEAETGEVKS